MELYSLFQPTSRLFLPEIAVWGACPTITRRPNCSLPPQVASGLCQRGLRAAPYHAGCDLTQRRSIQSAWQGDSLQVVVATIAFGLGIDKPGAPSANS